MSVRTSQDREVRVGLVGLGVIGKVHSRVLAGLGGARLVFVVDPRDPSEAPAAPHHRTLGAALAETDRDPDLIVVATPTDTHLELVAEALTRSDAVVLSEKPLARDAAALARFEGEHAPDLGRLLVVNHFAFSPEVAWAADLVARSGWGRPAQVFSSFNDPYVLKTAAERRSYVSSWVDSGTNQLSILLRFADGLRLRRHHHDDGAMRSVTDVDFDGGSATLASNWWTGDSSKQTILRWRAGREVFLDHTSMTGYASEGGQVREHFGHDGRVDRKAAHYSAMYRALLSGNGDHLLGLPLARTVAELLSAPSALPPTGDSGPTWATGPPTPPRGEPRG